MTTRKRLYTIKRFFDLNAKRITFTAHDLDDKPINGMDLRFDMNKLNSALHTMAMLQGCNHSIGDAGALPSGSTLKDKFDAMRERAQWLESGAAEWVGGREPGEGTLLAQALARCPTIKLKKALSEFTAAEKNALTANVKIAAAINAIRAERGKGIDTDELFDEID
jgi:hypothetical protein